MSLNLDTRLGLARLGSFTLGEVFSGQRIFLTGVASSVVFGTSTFKNGPHSLVLTGVRSSVAFGLTTFSNASAMYDHPRIFLSGVESFGLRVATATIESRLQTRSQSTFDLVWQSATQPTVPVVGQHFLFTENFRAEFSGFVTDVQMSIVPATNVILFTVQATDLSGLADRRKVFASYPSTSAKAIIQSIIENEIGNEGLTTNNVTVTATANAVVGAGQSLRQVLDKISQDTGGLWFIDVYGDIHMELPGAGGSAPWNITDTNKNVRNVMLRTSLQQYANTVTARTNQTLQ